MPIHARRRGFLCVLLLFASAPGDVLAAGQQRGAARARTNSDAESSELTIVAAKVQMLLIAPDGKKTGFEVKRQKTVKEIPNSSYYQDALLQYDSGRVDTDTTQTIDVKEAKPGKYRLIVSPGTAADEEEYEIRVTLYLRDGDEARTTRIAGTVEAGRTAIYEMRVNEDPGEVAVVDQQKQK